MTESEKSKILEGIKKMIPNKWYDIKSFEQLLNIQYLIDSQEAFELELSENYDRVRKTDLFDSGICEISKTKIEFDRSEWLTKDYVKPV